MEECIYSGNNEVEISQIQEILEKNGISPFVRNNHTENIFGKGIDLFAGEIEIYVLKDDVEKALAVLNEEIKTADTNNEEE